MTINPQMSKPMRLWLAASLIALSVVLLLCSHIVWVWTPEPTGWLFFGLLVAYVSPLVFALIQSVLYEDS